MPATVAIFVYCVDTLVFKTFGVFFAVFNIGSLALKRKRFQFNKNRVKIRSEKKGEI